MVLVLVLVLVGVVDSGLYKFPQLNVLHTIQRHARQAFLHVHPQNLHTPSYMQLWPHRRRIGKMLDALDVGRQEHAFSKIGEFGLTAHHPSAGDDKQDVMATVLDGTVHEPRVQGGIRTRDDFAAFLVVRGISDDNIELVGVEIMCPGRIGLTQKIGLRQLNAEAHVRLQMFPDDRGIASVQFHHVNHVLPNVTGTCRVTGNGSPKTDHETFEDFNGEIPDAGRRIQPFPVLLFPHRRRQLVQHVMVHERRGSECLVEFVNFRLTDRRRQDGNFCF